MASRLITALTYLCAITVNVNLATGFSKGKLRTGRAGECGRRQPVATGEPDKIVGGQDADHGEFPWQVSLQVKGIDYTHICGGSILDNTTIITAAHCTSKLHARSLQVVAGEHKLDHDDGTEQRIGISRIINHRSFINTGIPSNDIALLKLSSALDLSGKYARPICLPTVQNEKTTGDATVTGWGDLKFSFILGGYPANTLQKLSVRIFSGKKCRKIYKEDFFLDAMLCAGYMEGGKGVCQGDSGGPLMVERDDGIATLIGITSWGRGCAWPKLPAVFTRVSHFLKWISKNLA